jgi:hypothetical protein
VLSLKNCRLGRTGAVRLAEAIASFLSAFLVELDLERNDIGAGGGRSNNVDPLVSGFGQIYLTVKYI